MERKEVFEIFISYTTFSIDFSSKGTGLLALLIFTYGNLVLKEMYHLIFMSCTTFSIDFRSNGAGLLVLLFFTDGNLVLREMYHFPLIRHMLINSGIPQTEFHVLLLSHL